MTQAVAPAVSINEPQKKEHQGNERLYTFAEYLEYEGEPDVLYELYRGRLIRMPAATHLHTDICKFLLYKLLRYLTDQNLDLVAHSLATGVRTEENSSRIPDVVVCTQSVWEQVKHRTGAGVLYFAEKPILVVEVVSSNARDDYVIKRSEYEIAEIPEYWIIDPKQQRVRVFTNPTKIEGYSFVDFTEDQSIVSGQFDRLVLSAKELLDPPQVELLMKEEQAKIQAMEQQAILERQRAETERQRAETERQRAEKFAQRLLEMGINPDEID